MRIYLSRFFNVMDEPQSPAHRRRKGNDFASARFHQRAGFFHREHCCVFSMRRVCAWRQRGGNRKAVGGIPSAETSGLEDQALQKGFAAHG
jgi:hypothetical protein